MEESAMVLESARPRLSALAPIAAKLNASSDAFTEELKVIEAELSKLNLGVDLTYFDESLAEGDLREERDDQDDRLQSRFYFATFLAYGKRQHPSAWRLLAREYRVDLDGNDYVERRVFLREKPLVEASRELRIAAATQINALLDEITKQASDKVTKLREVIEKK
jgi:hypothetical protein